MTFFLHFALKILDPPNASLHPSFAALREEWDMEVRVPCLSAWNPGGGLYGASWGAAQWAIGSTSGLSDLPLVGQSTDMTIISEASIIKV